MKVKNKVVYENLDKLFEESPEIILSKDQKWVIFSDLHMGDGGATDDFKTNAEMFSKVLREHYHPNDHTLILNGDVEEIQRNRLSRIFRKWSSVFDLFEEFASKDRLIKIFGNHDLDLTFIKRNERPFKLYEAIRLKYKEDSIFVFHGHQASKKFQKHNRLIGYTLRLFCEPPSY